MRDGGSPPPSPRNEQPNEEVTTNEKGNENNSDADSEEDKPKPPDFTRANALHFSDLCRRLEKVWAQRRVRVRKPTTDQMLACGPAA